MLTSGSTRESATTYAELLAALKREDGARWRAAVVADPVRAARWRAQKRQWWREHRAKWPVTVRVAP
jgi:hypothetical protein